MSRRRSYTQKHSLDSSIDFNWNIKQFDAFIRAANYGPFSSPSYVPNIVSTSGKIYFSSYKTLEGLTPPDIASLLRKTPWSFCRKELYLQLTDKIVKVENFWQASL